MYPKVRNGHYPLRLFETPRVGTQLTEAVEMSCHLLVTLLNGCRWNCPKMELHSLLC